MDLMNEKIKCTRQKINAITTFITSIHITNLCHNNKYRLSPITGKLKHIDFTIKFNFSCLFPLIPKKNIFLIKICFSQNIHSPLCRYRKNIGIEMIKIISSDANTSFG